MRYFLFITGCDMNRSDSERVASVFNEHGFSITDKEGEADVLVAVACSVREKAVHKILGKINEWGKAKKQKKKKANIVVTGCILEKDKKKMAKKSDLVFEIKDIGLLKEFLGDQDKLTDSYLAIDPVYQSSYSVNVPIMTGCDNFCTYCAVPYTRGREVSRPEKDILQEFQSLVDDGYREITLLGQNVNSYGGKNQKSKNSFVHLLEKIDSIPGDYWVRFYSNHPKDMSEELIEFLSKSKHFCHYIHLPLQSGDDEIIKKMNRHYTAKQYLELVKKIKKKLPGVTLTTDIIVGFPGETDEAFENTVSVMKESGFDMAFIAEYSPRGGTIASKMEDNVPHEEKERRKKFLNDEILAKSVFKNNKRLVGKVIQILVYRDYGKGTFFGKTKGLKDVRVGGTAKVGNFIEVEISKANSWGMEGEIVK